MSPQEQVRKKISATCGEMIHTHIYHTDSYIYIYYTHICITYTYIPVHTNIAHNHLYISTYCMNIHTYHDFPKPDKKTLGQLILPPQWGQSKQLALKIPVTVVQLLGCVQLFVTPWSAAH